VRTFAGKEDAGDQETVATVSQGSSTKGDLAGKVLRQHRSVVAETWRASGLLCHWQKLGEHFEGGEDPPGNFPESTFREEVGALKKASADKVVSWIFSNILAKSRDPTPEQRRDW
jgi:hypothetical protein